MVGWDCLAEWWRTLIEIATRGGTLLSALFVGDFSFILNAPKRLELQF